MPTTDSPPRIDCKDGADGTEVCLHGCWTAPQMAQAGLWRRLEREQARLRGVQHWDLRAAQRLDHTGAQWLWNQWGRRWPARVLAWPGQRAMLERVAQFTPLAAPVPAPGRWAWLVALGHWGLELLDHLVSAVRLLGQLALDLGALLRQPRRAPWRDLSGHIYRIGATALPITALVGFLIGVVLTYLMSRQLQTFGADIFIVNILGLSLTRELGPVLAAILLAGRSGSAITAQIGVMRVTEEIDAMRVMGIPRGYRLVLPRALAMLLVTPVVAVWTTAMALLGGMVVADLAMGLTPGYFLNALPRAIKIANLWLAVGKSAVFGLFIALIGCHFGLRVLPNTQSLGEGTTAAVVVSITMVLTVDAVFAVVFKNVGI
ncbi:MAG: MlaE family ABC transporter permease [Rhodoferax sp.]